MTDEQFQLILNELKNINTRLDRLENRMDRLESRMDGLESRMDGLESRMDRQESRQDNLEKNQNNLSNSFSEFRLEQFNFRRYVQKEFDKLEKRSKREHQELRDIINKNFEEHAEQISEITLAIKGISELAVSNQKKLIEHSRIINYLCDQN